LNKSLGLEQIAERVDRRRVVGVPGEVAEQTLALVSGPDRKRAELRRLIEEHDHPAPGAHVAQPARRHIQLIRVPIAIDHRRNVDRALLDTEVPNDPLSVFQALRRRCLVRQPKCDDLIGTERPRTKVSDHGRIHTAGKAEDDLFDLPASETLIPQEPDEPVRDETGIDAKRLIRRRIERETTTDR